MKKVKKYFLILLALMMSNFIPGCASPLLKLPQDELRSYSTEELILAGRGIFNTWAFDPEIDQELIRRQKEDIQRLIENAASLEDFENIRFSFQNPTKASQIEDKYERIPRGVYVNNKFTSVSAKWVDGEKFDNARRQWYVNKHPELRNEIRKSVLNSESSVHHRLVRGMTEEQVIATIGYPNDINRSTGEWGVHEQWIYGGLIGRARYFYFENGILTSWQN